MSASTADQNIPPRRTVPPLEFFNQQRSLINIWRGSYEPTADQLITEDEAEQERVPESPLASGERTQVVLSPDVENREWLHKRVGATRAQRPSLGGTITRKSSSFGSSSRSDSFTSELYTLSSDSSSEELGELIEYEPEVPSPEATRLQVTVTLFAASLREYNVCQAERPATTKAVASSPVSKKYVFNLPFEAVVLAVTNETQTYFIRINSRHVRKRVIADLYDCGRTRFPVRSQLISTNPVKKSNLEVETSMACQNTYTHRDTEADIALVIEVLDIY